MGSEQRNALLAVVLSGLILFGWQYFFAPPKPANAPIEPATPQSKTEEGKAVLASSNPAGGPIEPVAVAPITISSSNVSVTFDSNLTFTDFLNPQAAFSFDKTVESKQPMKVEFDFGNGFKSLTFTPAAEANTYVNVENNLTLKASVDEKGVAHFQLFSPNDFKYRMVFSGEHKKLENGQERKFALYTDQLDLYAVGDDETGDKPVKWAGVDFNYHLFGMYLEKETPLLFKASTDKTFSVFSNKSEKSLSFGVVFVKKEYDYLASLGHNLQNAVDFGIWGVFAVWILKGLQFFYKFIPNYGVSIILLTLLIRLITFPLQWKSMVSMKKLQVIQPELNKIREKFKEDPQRMQKESMELFKRSGANPIGGCLPLLLQMPVFFAFYKVLYSAVELVDAPFVLWIYDLSNKDPYFVLPILMTGAMFLQQKLTPNTITDPVQKKVMMFMPLIFGFIMKDLPSGLSLYIFVSTLFGIIQQLLVFNAHGSNKPVVV